MFSTLAKSNLPYMAELSCLTVPLNGHALNVSKLALESCQGVLNALMKKATFTDFQVKDVQQMLDRHMQTRITQLVDEILLHRQNQEYAMCDLVRTLPAIHLSIFGESLSCFKAFVDQYVRQGMK